MCQQVKGVARTRVMASAMCSRDFQSCVPSQTHSVGEERGLVEVFAGDSVFAMGCWEGHDLQDWLSPILWAKQLQLRPDWCACANDFNVSCSTSSSVATLLLDSSYLKYTSATCLAQVPRLENSSCI